MDSPASAEALIPRFKLDRILNQDQAGRRLTLLGTIDAQPSLLLVERAALPSTAKGASALHGALSNVSNLGANDIYAWYMASVSHASSTSSNAASTDVNANTKANNDASSPNSHEEITPDLKLNLIHPCTPAHVRKYSPQLTRIVTETPQIFREHVRPYMERQRAAGRLNWVYNILEGRTEQEDVIMRSASFPPSEAEPAEAEPAEAEPAEAEPAGEPAAGFLLLPDMNWDRRTMASLRILGLVERRDLLSLRDLRKRDVPWLKALYAGVLAAVTRVYAAQGVEADLLKVYVHYQPTYYHFHVHVVHAALEPNATQGVGKAFSLPNLISQLETMAGGDEAGMADVVLTYGLGESSALWEEVFAVLKKGGGEVKGGKGGMGEEGEKERGGARDTGNGN